jgi:hypothetical protein
MRSEILVLLDGSKGAWWKRIFLWMSFYTFIPNANLTVSWIQQLDGASLLDRLSSTFG